MLRVISSLYTLSYKTAPDSELTIAANGVKYPPESVANDGTIEIIQIITAVIAESILFFNGISPLGYVAFILSHTQKQVKPLLFY